MMTSPTQTAPLPRKPTKLQTVSAQLADLAHVLGPGAKLPTVLQLRDHLGVSLATLNSALTDLETQNIILRRHGVGVFVSLSLHRKNIALLCDPSFYRVAGLSPFWDMLVQIARSRAQAKNEGFSLHFARPAGFLAPPNGADGSDGSPLGDTLVADLQANRVDGVLGIGVQPEAVALLEQSIPFVSFAGRAQYMVVLDGHESIKQGIRALSSQKCKRIAYWSPYGSYRIAETDDTPGNGGESYEWFCQALRDHNLPVMEEFIRTGADIRLRAGQWSEESNQMQGYRLACHVWGNPNTPKPDGLFCSDDIMMRGALSAFAKLNVRVGHDVIVASHANAGSEVLLGHEDEMTLIEYDPAEVVGAMFEMLETLMDGNTPTDRVTYVLPRTRRPKEHPLLFPFGEPSPKMVERS